MVVVEVAMISSFSSSSFSSCSVVLVARLLFWLFCFFCSGWYGTWSEWLVWGGSLIGRPRMVHGRGILKGVIVHLDDLRRPVDTLSRLVLQIPSTSPCWEKKLSLGRRVHSHYLVEVFNGDEGTNERCVVLPCLSFIRLV